jgi:hypothetical protein
VVLFAVKARMRGEHQEEDEEEYIVPMPEPQTVSSPPAPENEGKPNEK